MKHLDNLQIFGIEENNLKNVDVKISHNTLTVVTGVSGSGKSTLAFDTVHAEGGRRYIETFSPYTRQFLDRLHQPKIKSITGVRPSLALEQQNRTVNSRSTVGTVTEINDYLKVLWSQLASISCPKCGDTIEKNTPTKLAEKVLAAGKAIKATEVVVGFSIKLTGEASANALGEMLEHEGFLRFFSPGMKQVFRINDEKAFTDELKLNDTLIIVQERVHIQSYDTTTTFDSPIDGVRSAIVQSLTHGHGVARAILLGDKVEELALSNKLFCPTCNLQFNQPSPSFFSFNSPLGACKTCNGFGAILGVDRDLVVPNPELPIAKGAIACWNSKATRNEFRKLLKYCESENIDVDTPWKLLSASAKELIFSGSPDGKLFRGIDRWFKRLQRKQYKMHVRVFLSRYRGQFICNECLGTRLRKEALLYRISGMTLPEIWTTPIEELKSFFFQIERNTPVDPASEIALQELISRVNYIDDIGLGYLTLDRQTRTLSGGESQRVNLTSILGARLVNTMLVLDEPTIGLHDRDTFRLTRALTALREKGNSLLVVEHDARVIEAADEVIDLGPLSGSEGGRIVYQGNVSGLLQEKSSLTGKYLKNPIQYNFPAIDLDSSKSQKILSLIGAKANNLKNINVDIPLNKLVVITGVSGSGKSSLLYNCLWKIYERVKKGASLETVLNLPESSLSDIVGLNEIDEIVLINQSPVGKTPRSNPATYTKAWDLIRECFAETPQAQKLGLGKSAFSFNVSGGRCPTCDGSGYQRVEMQFLADVFIECEECGGKRFQEQVLSVRFAGKNVAEILNTTLADVVAILEETGDSAKAQAAKELLKPLADLGLDYLRLGHPLNNLSGGEAQRVKLAAYLKENVKKRCLFLLDEPTTGLHPHNIVQLLTVFGKLLESGHSLLCIEHNRDIISHADYLIDLGPEGGKQGGYLLAAGKPEDLLKAHNTKQNSQTLSVISGQVNTPSNLQSRIPPKIQDNKQILEHIKIIGARHHNLKNISVDIPQNKFVVITGISGSGKSTLAFDILFSEGQRRYIECLSPYARQYITQLQRAEVDLVDNIPPTIAVSQKTAPPLGVSTVATTTELYQYLRLLYAKVGVQHCPEHMLPMSQLSPELIADRICKIARKRRVFIFAPVISGRKGYYTDLFIRALHAEIEEARIDGKIYRLTHELRLERHKLHWISLLIGSLSVPEKNRELLIAAIEQALFWGNGTIEITFGEKSGEPIIYSSERMCPKCHRGFRELDPQDFSFRSRRGICHTCEGRGKIGNLKTSAKKPCPDCDGARIGPIGRSVTICNKTIYDITKLTSAEIINFFKSWDFDSRLSTVIEPIMKEVLHRLDVIIKVGLDYLTLDRDSSTLSGGEAQRLRLAKTMGSPLTGICYVLDEPTIGLHPQDHARLLDTLFALRNNGNTVVVVEHDEETIFQADHIIDVGPLGGMKGGNIVHSGTIQSLISCKQSLTGQALLQRAEFETESFSQKTGRFNIGNYIALKGAHTNNLKNINVKLPLNQFTVVAGISGAGKSSFVHGTLVPAITSLLMKQKVAEKTWDEIEIKGSIKRLLEIDQAPVGRTSASCPASYLGIFDELRKVYAEIPEAKIQGWDASYFSFNTGEGRCKICNGKGYIKIPMSFLPDAETECESCRGYRYSEEALAVLFQGVSLGELLKKTIVEAAVLLKNHVKISRSLQFTLELGLGYLTLGQPTHTLSGGEAQRLKIARELGLREAIDTVYILDEPTVGLHMVDVEKLLNVLRMLVKKGNTVLVVEHNLDVVCNADYLIELGPEPAERGGKLLFSGSPQALINKELDTPTFRAIKNKEKNRIPLPIPNIAQMGS